MTGPYDDILYLPHHVSPTRTPMSMTDRGAQFSPFAALVGFDAAIEETGRRTDSRAELDESCKEALSQRLAILADAGSTRPEITVTYFVPDGKKSGGSYRTLTGLFRKIDPYEHLLLVGDAAIPINEISDIRGRIFEALEYPL